MQLTEQRMRPIRGHSPKSSPAGRRPPRGPRPEVLAPGPAAAATSPAGLQLAPLVAAAKAGCSASFERLYRLLAGQVASYLRWQRASDPDGLTNDVFAQVHRNLGHFEGDERGFRSWLFTIAHHRMIDDRRQASRQVAAHGDDALDENRGGGDVEEEAFAAMSRHEVEDLLAVLSPDQREVVLLRIVADLPVEEVARLVGKQEGAVKALQHRALARLRRHLVRTAVHTAP